MWEGLTKNGAKILNKQKLVPRVPFLALGEEPLPRVLEQGTQGRGVLPRVLVQGSRGRFF
jgi:hypothetical protein